MAYTPKTWTASDPMDSDNLAYTESQATILEDELEAVTHSERYYTIAQCDAAYWKKATPGPITGADADKLCGKTLAEVIAASAPKYTVIWWHGDIATPPTGWAYCDGTNGTPDARGKYILGADYSHELLSTGGAAVPTCTGTCSVYAHTLTEDEIPGHKHTLQDLVAGGTTLGCVGERLMKAMGAAITPQTGYVGSGGSHLHDAAVTSGTWNNRPSAKALHLLMAV